MNDIDTLNHDSMATIRNSESFQHIANNYSGYFRTMFSLLAWFNEDHILMGVFKEDTFYIRSSKETRHRYVDLGLKNLKVSKDTQMITHNYFELKNETILDSNSFGEILQYTANLFCEKKKKPSYEQLPLNKLANMRRTLRAMLRGVGITNHEELKEVGSVLAYKRLVEQRGKNAVSVDILYSLEGALCGIHATVLPEPVKNRLHEQLRD